MNTIFKTFLKVLVLALLVGWTCASPIGRSNDQENRSISYDESDLLAAEAENLRQENAVYKQLSNLQQKKYPFGQAHMPMSGHSNDDKFIKSILETLSIFGNKNNHQMKNVASKDFFGK
jgi:hypothetical protein